MQIEIFPVKMQVVCISINTSYVSILSLHKTWDSLVKKRKFFHTSFLFWGKHDHFN